MKVHITQSSSPFDLNETYSFDLWGRRRNPTNWTYTGVPASFTFSRGYTGHEMLDVFGLINMNVVIVRKTASMPTSGDQLFLYRQKFVHCYAG